MGTILILNTQMRRIFTVASFHAVLLAACVPSERLADTRPSQDASPADTTIRTAPAAIDPEILRARRFTEAPILAAKVSAGALPPVADRLPGNPLIIRPVHQIGRYGGSIRRMFDNENGGISGIRKTLNDGLVGYERPFARSIESNLAEHYEFLDGGRVAIFRLRKGVRWSDGHPFTAEDYLFFYNDFLFDLDASDTALPPGEWLIDGEPIKVEKDDAFTLRFSAPKPMGRLLHALARQECIIPRHYWRRYHPKYNPQADYEDFRKRARAAGRVFQPGVPRLSAWVPSSWVAGQRVVFERNPFYWKIDTAGNQLPYVDRLSFDFVPDRDVMLLRFLNGQADLFGRYAGYDMIDTLRSEERKGKFKLYSKETDSGIGAFFNWSAEDPSLRRAFRDKRVRVAFSLGINREEISEIVFGGALQPGGYSFAPANPHYDPESFQRYAQYDPGQARQLLDDASYRDSDGDGVRELHDGAPFEAVLDVVLQSHFADVSELIVEQWKDIGIRIHLNPCTEEVHFDRRVNGKFEIYLWTINGSIDPFDVLHYWSIVRPGTPMWYQSAYLEKPDWLARATELLNEGVVTLDPVRLAAIMGEVREIFTDKIPAVGVGSLKGIWAASKRLGNVPEAGTFDHIYRGWSRPVFHEQLFFREE